jgi:GT2 family glycosyltransferase
MNRVAIVVPNWNGADLLRVCIDSLLSQTYKKISIIIVENGSVDESMDILKTYGNKITVLPQKNNLGFAGGVNVGINYALENNFKYLALFNNDARAEKKWIENLVNVLDDDNKVGIVTSKILIDNTGKLDSTGDWFTTTGMPFPRGRGEIDKEQYDNETLVFGASGGASLYRTSLFKDIGLFDEDFFAYYEDVDISFRAQLRGWLIKYEPTAVVYHKLSATSNKLGYFAIKQSARNFWLLFIRNVPTPLLFRYLPSALYRYARMFAARLLKGGFGSFFSGFIQALILLPKKISERRTIQKGRVVSIEYLVSVIHKGKPPITRE